MPNTNQLEDFGSLVESLFLDPSGNCDTPTGAFSAPVSDLIKAAIESPINYPKLAESVFPGDQISVLLQPDLPNPDLIINALTDAMSSVGIETEGLQGVIAAKC